MTALNFWIQDDAAHFVMDAASYYPTTGEVAGFGSKLIVLHEFGVAFAARGRVNRDVVLSVLDVIKPTTKAEALDAMLPTCVAIFEANNAHHPDDPLNHVSLSAIGWDDKQDRPVGYHVGTGRIVLFEGMQPFVRYSGGMGWMSPQLEDWDGIVWNDLDPVIDGPRILEAQRQQTPLGPFSVVGGYGEACTLTREGLTLRRICEWPEDRIGHPIIPKRAKAA